MKYLHIGNGVSVRHEDVIGIFDLDSATVSHITKDFIKKCTEKEIVTYGDHDLPRSFVVCKSSVCLSRISSSSLAQRCKDSSGFTEEE